MGSTPDTEPDECQKKTSCFSNIKIFLISECALMLAQGTVGAYLVSVLTTLERRFNLQSADVGVIASSFEIGNLALILFVSYFGARAHRPRLIGCGGIVMALGALLSALPEFLTHQYEYQSGESRPVGQGKDLCSNTSRAGLSDPGYICGNRTNTNMMYLLLIGAQMLLGIGATPLQPLGVSYIDDHVRREDSSLYIGILFSTLVFGPACGFILGSLCTKVYVDAVFIDTTTLDITPDDPRWIGAWWGGFIICGLFLFLSSLFMFGFPQSLNEPGEDPGGESEQAMLPAELVQEYEGVKASDDPDQINTVIPKVTKHLLSNPVFTCVILAACMEIAVVAGFAAFLGKYLEQQFNLSTSSANQLLGMTAIPCACLGIFLSGLLVKKLNLSALGAIRLAMLVNIISTACYVSFLFLGCDTGPVAGVTVAYGNESLGSWERTEAACLSGCNCYTSSLSPVCGSNGITYLSACLAGCTKTICSPSSLSQNLTGCKCIAHGDGPGTAMPGKCSNPGCQQAFLTFLAVVCACSMIGAMAQTPSVIILIRTLEISIKNMYSTVTLSHVFHVPGFIPPPLIFGVGIDSTCLLWSSVCGIKGACMLYDNITYRYLYVSIAIVLKSSAFILYAVTWQCLRQNYSRYIKNCEDYLTPSQLFASNLTLDNLGKDIAQNPSNRTKFIYNLDDHAWSENMESAI
uniref:Solute carrier organic anion transporter family member n=1 Tax=Sinocyclocheilus grahami TaxID=75366 RepID=A0A672SVZ8_SINGR